MLSTAIIFLTNGDFRKKEVLQEPIKEVETPIINMPEQKKAFLRWKIDKKELAEAKRRIFILEQRLKSIESNLPRPYPNVKFLSYRVKKRILVSMSFYTLLKQFGLAIHVYFIHENIVYSK